MSSLLHRLPLILAAVILFVLILTAGADARPLTGSPGADRLTVNLTGGNTVRAGGGNDRVIGNMGPDQIYGETGGDELSGRAGDDMLDGGSGDDSLVGEFGNDTWENESWRYTGHTNVWAPFTVDSGIAALK